jgi:hypothetical protein
VEVKVTIVSAQRNMTQSVSTLAAIATFMTGNRRTQKVTEAKQELQCRKNQRATTPGSAGWTFFSKYCAILATTRTPVLYETNETRVEVDRVIIYARIQYAMPRVKLAFCQRIVNFHSLNIALPVTAAARSKA